MRHFKLSNNDLMVSLTLVGYGKMTAPLAFVTAAAISANAIHGGLKVSCEVDAATGTIEIDSATEEDFEAVWSFCCRMESDGFDPTRALETMDGFDA